VAMRVVAVAVAAVVAVAAAAAAVLRAGKKRRAGDCGCSYEGTRGLSVSRA